MYVPRIVITSGEPAGIGPDACVTLAQTGWDADIVVAADADVVATPRFEWSVESFASVDREGCAPGT